MVDVKLVKLHTIVVTLISCRVSFTVFELLIDLTRNWSRLQFRQVRGNSSVGNVGRIPRFPTYPSSYFLTDMSDGYFECQFACNPLNYQRLDDQSSKSGRFLNKDSVILWELHTCCCFICFCYSSELLASVPNDVS